MEHSAILPGQFTWDVESDSAIARTEEELLSLLPGPATASEFVELGERVDGGPPDDVDGCPA